MQSRPCWPHYVREWGLRKLSGYPRSRVRTSGRLPARTASPRRLLALNGLARAAANLVMH